MFFVCFVRFSFCYQWIIEETVDGKMKKGKVKITYNFSIDFFAQLMKSLVESFGFTTRLKTFMKLSNLKFLQIVISVSPCFHNHFQKNGALLIFMMTPPPDGLFLLPNCFSHCCLVKKKQQTIPLSFGKLFFSQMTSEEFNPNDDK